MDQTALSSFGASLNLNPLWCIFFFLLEALLWVFMDFYLSLKASWPFSSLNRLQPHLTPSLATKCVSALLLLHVSYGPSPLLVYLCCISWDVLLTPSPPSYAIFFILTIIVLANVGKLMNVIRNVQCLEVSTNTLELLSVCCNSMPVFNNLKSLTIKSDEKRGWRAMPVLLRNCPHLETLVLEGLLHHVTDKCGDACDCVSREDKGRSLTFCPVKELEIKEIQGTMKEMHMIKHFLNYFLCLKEIKIYMEENGPTQLSIPEVSEVIAERMKLYNKLSNCNVQLLVNGSLSKEWNAQ